MLWLKAFHIVAVVTWFAGLLYLPRLFVYHAEATEPLQGRDAVLGIVQWRDQEYVVLADGRASQEARQQHRKRTAHRAGHDIGNSS